MNFRDKVFIAVAENLSFSKAAEYLYISQPAVSKHIQELESFYGLSLFERKGNRVVLTHAGTIVYQKLKQIQHQYSELEFSVGSITNQFKGELRVGSSSTISQYVIPSVLARFNQKYPSVGLTLYNGNSHEMERLLLDGMVDVALVENASSSQGLRYGSIANDSIVAVVGITGTLARVKELSVSDLLSLPLVLREHGSGTLQVIQREFELAGVSISQLNVLLHLGSTEAIKGFVECFDAVALVSERAIAKELRLNTLRVVPLKGISFYRQFRYALRFGESQKLAQTFVDFAVSSLL